MPLFKLKNPFEKKQDTHEDYLALTITPTTVIATIWNFSNDEVNVIATAERNFGSPETIVHEAAVAIDKAAEKSSTDVNKVVFGLSSSWFENGKIKDSAAQMLKNLTNDLELEAQAFVTIAIAINHLLKAEESITPQALLIGNFNDFTEVHLVKNNEVIATKTASGEVTTHKIIKLVNDLKQENDNLPAKIIIFGQDPQQVAQKLEGAKLEELFVHPPRIDIFSNELLAKSVAFAQAADILGRDPQLKNQKPQEIKKDSETEAVPAITGFIEGEDVLKMQEEAEIPLPPPPPEPKVEPVYQEPLDPHNYAVEIGQSDNLQMPQHRPAPKPSRKLIPSFSLPKLIPSFKFSLKKIAIAAGVIILLAIVGTIVAGQTLTAAQVVIKANAKTQSEQFSAKVVTGSSGDIEKGEIPGQIVVGSAQNSQKAVATGSKKTGTNAKGQVTIQNWVKEEKTFPSGTELITKDGLKFTIDNEVKAATGSAHPPGEVTVGATAKDVGPAYNISSGQDLSIVGFDEFYYSAKTNTTFTGGDQKQITVVSKDDVAKLEKSLTDSLIEKAKQDLESKSGGLKIYDESKVVKVTKKEYDKK
ncbi:hypothetical protein HY024_04145 [Candidatus Curtissbacteria bacterium]|nr:hypothetical protein [Candidatus Curtissbacteria bacterium]